MEKLPYDVLGNILSRLTDARSLANFALTSRMCRDAFNRVDIVRPISMPVRDMYQVMHLANLIHAQQNTPLGFSHCLLCVDCKCIMPVSFEAVVVNHKCVDHSYFRPIWTNSRHAVLYRGPTDHLTQPVPCSSERLGVYRVPKPSVFPYSLNGL